MEWIITRGTWAIPSDSLFSAVTSSSTVGILVDTASFPVSRMFYVRSSYSAETCEMHQHARAQAMGHKLHARNTGRMLIAM